MIFFQPGTKRLHFIAGHLPSTILRRDVLPIIEELWPDAARRVSGTADAVETARCALDNKIALTFGEASQRVWSRREMADLPLPLIAAGLRRAALDESPDSTDDLGQRLLLPAAESIKNTDRHPKEFHWPGGLMLKITSGEVHLLSSSRVQGEPPGQKNA